ncbi:MAG TPA: 6-phosphofructokinase [Clostridiales bacterium]|nr:6-phosphofructokinase [Clostridiales bacterium]
MKRIAVLTSGGDAPGMNAAIRAVVRAANFHHIEVYGVSRGYCGLIEGDLQMLSRRSVSDTIQRGGTILKTARSVEFTTYEGRKKAAEVLSERGIDGLVVIGGDGSLRGANDLWKEFGVKTVGVPGTIDNDLGYTDRTIGFDTAVNTALSAINNLRDTMSSHDRVVIVQVMGRHSGEIALHAGLAGGAEVILVPEKSVDLDDVASILNRGKAVGKTSGIVVLAEGAMPLDEVMGELKERTGLSFRSTVLGYIQRGGSPSMEDRVLASRLGVRAVELLKDNKGGRVVGVKGGEVIDLPISEALAIAPRFDEVLYEQAKMLSL